MFSALGRFMLQDAPGMGSVWTPPAGVIALVDLVPPGQDANPDVNFALMLSDSELPSDVCHHSFGSGDIRELQMTSTDRSAWLAVTGIDPGDGTVADSLVRHLTINSDATGQEACRPLMGMRQDIWLGERVYRYRPTGPSDPAWSYIWPGILQSIRDVVAADASDIEIAKYYGGLEIQYHLAFGTLPGRLPDDELLPKIASVRPQTIKTETFSTNTSLNSSSLTGDNGLTWTISHGSLATSSGVVSPSGTNGESCVGILGYSFAGPDRISQGIQANGGGNTWCRVISRADATGDNGYAGGQTGSINQAEIYKIISGTATSINAPLANYTTNDVINFRSIGSTHTLKKNGTTIATQTDTAISIGAYSGIWLGGSASLPPNIKQPFSFDDTIASLSGMPGAMHGGNLSRFGIRTGGNL